MDCVHPPYCSKCCFTYLPLFFLPDKTFGEIHIFHFCFWILKVKVKQGLRRTRKLRQCTNWKENLRICELAKASNKKNWSVQLVRPAGSSSWYVQLVRPAGPSSGSVQLVHPAGPSSWFVQLVQLADPFTHCILHIPSYAIHLARCFLHIAS